MLGNASCLDYLVSRREREGYFKNTRAISCFKGSRALGAGLLPQTHPALIGCSGAAQVLASAGSSCQIAGSTRGERFGSSEVSPTLASIRAVFAFWPGSSLAWCVANKCTATARTGQMKAGVCTGPGRSRWKSSGSCAFPTPPTAGGLEQLSAEVWVAKRHCCLWGWMGSG